MDLMAGLGGGVSGPLVFSGGPSSENPIVGGGGDGGLGRGGGGFAWRDNGDENYPSIRPGFVMVGRRCLYVNGQTVYADGSYWVKVTFNPSESAFPATAEIIYSTTKTVGAGYVHEESSTETYLPLYRVVDGKVEFDGRGPFVVPCWE